MWATPNVNSNLPCIAHLFVCLFVCLFVYLSQVKVLNDSKEVVATLYLTSIILVVVLAITIFLDEYVNVYAAGYSFGITLSTVVMLGVVFLSKVSHCSKNSERQKYMYIGT